MDGNRSIEIDSLGKQAAEILRPLVQPGEKLIWREPFRWKDDNGVLSNHYEMFDLPTLCADFGYTVVIHMWHAAIVEDKK